MTLEELSTQELENEHENNELHQLCRYKEYCREQGVPEKQARQYIKWYVKYHTNNGGGE